MDFRNVHVSANRSVRLGYWNHHSQLGHLRVEISTGSYKLATEIIPYNKIAQKYNRAYPIKSELP